MRSRKAGQTTHNTITSHREYTSLENSTKFIIMRYIILKFVNFYFALFWTQYSQLISLKQIKQNSSCRRSRNNMSEGDRTLTWQFVEVGDAHVSAESASDVEDNLQSQILERKLSSSDIDRRKNATVAALVTKLATLIQAVKELSEKSSNRATEGIMASKRSRSSGHCSDIHE